MMTLLQISVATVVWIGLITITYGHSSLHSIKQCYSMLFTKEYWTNYNTVEFVSWVAKSIIIVPGLIFGIQIWQLYFLTLITSLSLIWASNKKLLPTLVGFNTVWAWISLMVLSQHLIG